MSDQPLTIECGTHGRRRTGCVCGHLIGVTDVSLGFVENSSDPDNPQGWCDDCEKMFLRENGMTDVFLAFNDMAVVCVACYAQIKARHSTRSPRSRT